MKRNDLVRLLAIGICEKLGLDPSEVVQTSSRETRTPAEQDGYNTARRCKRWMTFRHEAAVALATREALREIEESGLLEKLEIEPSATMP